MSRNRIAWLSPRKGKQRATWIGEGSLKEGLTHYNGISIDGNAISVGDCALVESVRAGDDPFVCHVLALFVDHRGDWSASVMWFFRLSELEQVLQRKSCRSKGIAIDDDASEMEIYGAHKDLISVETLKSKCRVVVLAEDAEIPADRDEGDDEFYVRRFFELKSLRFVGAALIDKTGVAGKVRVPTVLEGEGVFLTGENDVPERIAVSGKRLRKQSQRYMYCSSPSESLVSGKKSPQKRKHDKDESDEDQEFVSTPKRKRRSKEGQSPNTPSRKRRTTLTPLKLPGRSTPCAKPRNALEEAKIKLHASAVPEFLPCREREFANIYAFCEERIMSNGSGCMYISGVPGTGKTATVHEVVACLEKACDEGDLEDFQYVEVNGMKVTEPQQIYPAILKQLTGEQATASHSQDLLLKWFCSPNPRRQAVLLVVDELDLLWTRKQTIMYNLFDWPGHKKSMLTVLAIANTMDLPERIMDKRVQSRMGLTRVSFQPYTHSQLQTIIRSRLQGIKAFDSESIELASRKVAAVSGDARRALDICRRAIELANKGTITMKNISEAVQGMFSAPTVVAIRYCSLYEKLFLRAIWSAFGKKGIEEASFGEVYRDHLSLCHLEGVEPLASNIVSGVCSRLGSCRLLLLEPGQSDPQRLIRLNVSQEDLKFGLQL